MLFNSYTFVFLFLPIVALAFFALGSAGRHTLAISWLVLSSLFFYAWWNPAYLGLIAGSMLFNFWLGKRLSLQKTRLLLVLGVTANLASIAYFKYANFFVNSVNAVGGANYHLEEIILPLAISFFTFQQIAYLVDAYRGETHEYDFLQYCLFVTFFPQLIAGPIVHHKEMMPQFSRPSIFRFDAVSVSAGLIIFSIGLFKKVVIADGVAVYATPVFDAARDGTILTLFEAWGGSIAYTFQLYFDFSGYSDMAIGCARIFGIHLPFNFSSPYKAKNIIEFWRRWHMTLSRFLRDYLYYSLGGNRKGEVRRYANLMITMVLGGLWHGAGWTFVFWGFLHGTYLCINHAWRAVCRRLFDGWHFSPRLTNGMSIAVTLLSVIIAWVFFRAETFESATSILLSMGGIHGVQLPVQFAGRVGAIEAQLAAIGVGFDGEFVIHPRTWIQALPILILSAVILALPNSNEIGKRIPAYIRTRPIRLAVVAASISSLAILSLGGLSEFLYFQF